MIKKIMTNEEINETAKRFKDLKEKMERIKKLTEKADKIKKLKERANEIKELKEKIKEFKDYQNYCAEKFSGMVLSRASKYRKFSNYSDLVQDGFEALMMALETYNPKKGNFSWWADKYIKTRLSRSANAHSTIKIPLKKAKDMQPYKTNSIPLLIDNSNNPLNDVERTEEHEAIWQALDELSETQKQAILMRHEFNGKKDASVSKISETLNISRLACTKLLSEAESKLRNSLHKKYKEI